jgi:glycosyltransferase involved in cell wall biosynthesis
VIRSEVGIKKIIYVGRLHKEKLVDDLMKMMAHLARDGFGSRRVQLVLLGDGPEREAI